MREARGDLLAALSLAQHLADEQLIAQRQRGERSYAAVVAELRRRYHQKVLRRIRSAIDDAELTEDVAQEVWLRVFRYLPRFRGEADLSALLLYTIVPNAVKTAGKRASRRDRHEIAVSQLAPWLVQQLEAAAVPGPEVQVIAKADLQSLYRAIDALPLHYREVADLKLQERTDPEIAHILGIPTGTVKSRFDKAKEILRERRQPDFDVACHDSSPRLAFEADSVSAGKHLPPPPRGERGRPVLPSPPIGPPRPSKKRSIASA